MKKIVVATRNDGKVREIKDAFSTLKVELVSLADYPDVGEAVEDGSTFRENALKKARFYHEKTGEACLADDSGLEVAALGGAPGVKSARFAGTDTKDASDKDNNEKLVKELLGLGLMDSAADYRCVLAFIDEDGTELVTEGRCDGTIHVVPHGMGGFGYDPYFYVDDERTMADITLEEKQKISHRGAALRDMCDKLADIWK